jgi:iron-sulfur cluster repair protein YtfE (RIC family)
MKAVRAAPSLFECLDSTHRGILEYLRLLAPLVDASETRGLNAANREQAHRILLYFNTEARQHHLDEEKHIFPVLLASRNAEIVHAAERLAQDHSWL